MMELLENGSLGDFITRCQAWGRPLPNRLLLRLFMCLIRTCIAMAWPPRKPRGATPRTEHIRGNDAEMSQLRHGDMHVGNLLFGNLDEEEHYLIPVLKLIDFDRAYDFPDPENENLGVKWNLFDIGLIMRTLITGDRRRDPPVSPVFVRVEGQEIFMHSAGADLANPNYPDLDDDIRRMVIMCLAVDPNQRPQLGRLHNRIRDWIRERGSGYYANFPRGRRHERESNLKDIVQRLIFDAPH
ncbi:hypothetical protein F4779DRAFT_305552 [Xylariaceae sp. FL0662B]|nr:hypothetical protein F4779DRAFT_305552 [Xylariaceae sp. FL0662B]